MAKAKPKKTSALFGLNPCDISWTGQSFRKSRRRKARLPRTLDVSSFSFAVTHEPTGICVEGHLPEGHYSRKHVQDLKTALLLELEKAIAQKLSRSR